MIMEWKPLTMLPCDDRTARERCQGPRRLQEKATPQSRSPADGAGGCRGGVCRGVRIFIPGVCGLCISYLCLCGCFGVEVAFLGSRE